MNLQTLFNTWNNEYFKGLLSNVQLITYSRKGNRHGFYRVRFGVRSININLNPTHKVTETDLQTTLLHEMIHAYLHVTNRPWGHTPLFKSMMRNLTEKVFGFRPTSNVRFHFDIPSPAVPVHVPSPVTPAIVPIAPVSNRWKVLSNGKLGTLLGYTSIYGKKHIRLQIPGLLFPFTCPIENAIPA